MDEYSPKCIEEAHRWLVKAKDIFAEAEILASSGKTSSGTYNRLYYASHHIAVALLRLINKPYTSHTAIIRHFSKEWVRTDKIPAVYGKLLSQLEIERKQADYGEYVPTFKKDIEQRIRSVSLFIKKASGMIPKITFSDILMQ